MFLLETVIINLELGGCYQKHASLLFSFCVVGRVNRRDTLLYVNYHLK